MNKKNEEKKYSKNLKRNHKIVVSDRILRIEKNTRETTKLKHAPSLKTGTLLAKRNKNRTILEVVGRKTFAIINYIKVTTGETKTYDIIPLSFRRKKLKKGIRKVLYAEDRNDNYHLKMFVWINIQKIAIGDRRVTPRNGFPIEIVPVHYNS